MPKYYFLNLQTGEKKRCDECGRMVEGEGMWLEVDESDGNIEGTLCEECRYAH